MEAVGLAMLGYGLPLVYLIAALMILPRREWVFQTFRGKVSRPYRVRGAALKALGWLSLAPAVGLLASLLLAATAFQGQELLRVGPFFWVPALGALVLGVPAYIAIRIVILASREYL
jgi:hypothetical protein